MKRKKYEKELTRLQAKLCVLQDWVKEKGLARHRRLRRPRRRGKGRDDQGHHGAHEPARLPSRRAARAVRPREVADVRAAVYAALSRRRRDRHLRPELVQPGRRRARDGLLHRRTVRALHEGGSGLREADDRRRDHPHQALARGREQGTGAAIQGPHGRSAASVEAEQHGPALARQVVRILAGARCDVQGHRHELGPLVSSSGPTTSGARAST